MDSQFFKGRQFELVCCDIGRSFLVGFTAWCLLIRRNCQATFTIRDIVSNASKCERGFIFGRFSSCLVMHFCPSCYRRICVIWHFNGSQPNFTRWLTLFSSCCQDVQNFWASFNWQLSWLAIPCFSLEIRIYLDSLLHSWNFRLLGVPTIFHGGYPTIIMLS